MDTISFCKECNKIVHNPITINTRILMEGGYYITQTEIKCPLCKHQILISNMKEQNMKETPQVIGSLEHSMELENRLTEVEKTLDRLVKDIEAIALVIQMAKPIKNT